MLSLAAPSGPRLLRDVAMVAVDFVELAIEESPNNEATFNSAIAPNRKSTNLLYPPSRSARISPAPTPLSRGDELRGIEGEVARLADTYEPGGVLTTRAYGDLLPHLFALAGFDYVVTAGNGVITDPDGAVIPANAWRWVFSKRQNVNARTARIRTNYKGENVEVQGYGFGVSSLAITAAAELSADLMGLYMRRLAADAVTVPVVQASSVQPFRRGDLFISALAGGGVPSDWSLSIANPLERIRTMSLTPASDWPDLMEQGDEKVAITGTIPKRVLTGTDYDALVAATTFAMTARWIGRSNIGATAKKYGLWIEMPKVQYVGGEQDELTNRRRRGFTPDWFAAWDEATGTDAKITVVNGVAAIETYV